MKKFKVVLGGRGAEIYIHPINEEQKQKLQEMNIEDERNDVDWDKLNETLGVENWDYSEEVYSGAYENSTAYHITVFDENDNEIFSSDDDFEMEIGEDENDYVMVEKENVLMIEHSVKGTFVDFILEIEEDFDSSKLTPVVVEVNEAVSVIKSLKYNGVEMEVNDYGDNWSKNVLFYIF